MQHDNEQPLPRQIYYAAREIKNLAEKILKPYGLTLEQYQLLRHLDSNDGVSQRQLGEQSGKTPANVTRILDRLQVKHLVYRDSHPVDRRSSLVFLTGEGRAVVDEVQKVLDGFSRELNRGISSSERQQVAGVLDRLSRNLHTISKRLTDRQEQA